MLSANGLSAYLPEYNEIAEYAVAPNGTLTPSTYAKTPTVPSGTDAEAFAQSFELVSAGGGAFAILNTNANKCVDVQARGTANGTKIQLFDCNQTTAQSFEPSLRTQI